jgi:hypothetical protein
LQNELRHRYAAPTKKEGAAGEQRRKPRGTTIETLAGILLLLALVIVAFTCVYRFAIGACGYWREFRSWASWYPSRAARESIRSSCLWEGSSAGRLQ